MKKTVFVVDDDLGFRELLNAVLSRDYTVRTFAEPPVLLRELEKEQPHLILADFTMPEMNGLELTEAVKAKFPALPVIVLTGYGTIDSAVAVLKAGAFHYLEKNLSGSVSSTNFTILKELINRAIESATIRAESAAYKSEVETLRKQVKRLKSAELIGESEAIRSIRAMVEQIAAIDSTVLIRGETGTGKNLVAERIHQYSRRDTTGRFVEVNCAALPETLLEAELFGYEQGAFTDARTAKKGLFETADNGTVFLDEIDSMSLLVQSKLLTVLESKQFRRVGGNETIKVDVRMICATNSSLEQKVLDRKFREDLFYRINVISLYMPPLRDLGNDVILIAERFVERFSSEMRKPVRGLSMLAKQTLLSHRWNGNVRELRNTIERAVIFTAAGDLIEPEQIILTPGQPQLPVKETGGLFVVPLGETPEETKPLEEIKLAYIRAVLKKFPKSYNDAARALDISQKSLWEIRKRYGLD